MQKSMVIGLSLGVVLCLAFTLPALYVAPPEETYAYLVVSPDQPALMMGAKGSILSLQVYQWTGSSWVFRGAAGSTGGTIALVAEQPVHFDVVVYVDYYTVSPVSCAGAMGDTRVYLAIAGQVSSTLMTVDSCPSNIPDVVWYVLFTYDWDAAGLPAAGASYTLTLTYQAYY